MAWINRTLTNRGLLFLVAFVTVLVLSVTAAVSQDGEDGEPVTSVDQGTIDALSVFQSPQTTEDQIPLEGTEPTLGSEFALPGENPALARRADPPGTGGPVYLWPKEDGVCFSTVGSASCIATSELNARGVAWTTAQGPDIPGGFTRVAGVAKDGISEIVVVLADRQEVSTPVSDNAFRADVDGSPVQLRWTDSEGKQALDVVAPDG